MEKIILTELVEKLESGSREKGGSINSGIISVGGTHLSSEGGFKWEKEEFVSESFYLKMRSGKIKRDDILIVKDGATTGKVSYVDELFPYREAAINEHVFRVQINPELANPKYVFYYLFSPKGQEQILSDYRGATIGGISRGFINKVEIPLPDHDTQNKIVAILDRIKGLIEKRENVIDLHNKLLRSIFFEMFGDPMDRNTPWILDTIGNNLTDITAGSSYGGDDKGYLDEDELGVLKISAVTKGVFDPTEFKAVKKKAISKKLVFPQKGDLLFSRANTLELVGATCIVDEDHERLFLPDKIWKVDTNELLLRKAYLHTVLQSKSVKDSFINIATGSSSSMLNISMEKFKNIQIPVPPLELQIKFENVYTKIISNIKKLTSAKTVLSILQKALSQQAFSGRSQYDIDLEMEAILYSFDLKDEGWKNKRAAALALNTIVFDQTYLPRLLDKLEDRAFSTIDLYNKAKGIVFIALKKKSQFVKQVFTESDGVKKIKVVVQ